MKRLKKPKNVCIANIRKKTLIIFKVFCHVEAIVQKAIQESDQNIIVLNPPVPWKRWVIGTEIEFVRFFPLNEEDSMHKQ